jgi:transposase InsO family protein
MTDQHSRFLIACDGMAAIDEDAACEASINAFKKFGVPTAIRTDNGVPFATTGLAGLSKLSVLWVLHGIELERIEPGKPQQNGRHERAAAVCEHRPRLPQPMDEDLRAFGRQISVAHVPGLKRRQSSRLLKTALGQDPAKNFVELDRHSIDVELLVVEHDASSASAREELRPD